MLAANAASGSNSEAIVRAIGAAFSAAACKNRAADRIS
jgi:hypothetical protein